MENRTVLDGEDARAVYREMFEENLYVAPLSNDAAGDCFSDTEAVDVVSESQGFSGQRKQLEVKDQKPSEVKPPRFAIHDDDDDSIVTLLMAVVAATGLVALVIFG